MFIISDRKNGSLVSALRMGAFWLVCVGLCAFAVTHKQQNLYWFITNFDTLLMIAVFALDSSGFFAKKVFMMTAYGIYFYVTMIPCDACFEFLPAAYSYIPYSPIRMTMYALLMLFWVKKGRAIFEKATEHISSKRWIQLCFFSVPVIFCVTFSMTHLIMLNRADTVWDYLISASILIIVISAYVVIIQMMAFLNSESDQRILNERIGLLQFELDSEEQFVELAKKNRHDLRHHNRVLLDYLEKNDTEGIRSYLEQYEKSLDETIFVDFCANPIANALLRRTAARCAENKIAFTCAAVIPENLPLSLTDTTVLFGNLLENSYHACLKAKNENAALTVKAQVHHQKLYVSVRNSVSGTVRFKNEIPQSDKKGGGIGVSSMLGVLEKCGGMAGFTQNGNEFITQMIVPLG